jgi:GTPase SAR1 family protein
MKESNDILLKEYHKKALSEFKICSYLSDIKEYSKVLFVGTAGVGKTTLIKKCLKDTRFNEVHSLLEITDLTKYDFIILFRNLELADNKLCKEFGTLYNIQNFEYIIIKKCNKEEA